MQVPKTTTSLWRAGKSNTPLIKAYGKGGFSLSRHHFIAEVTSPVREENKEQEQKPTTHAHSADSASHCLYIQHLNID
jgi:hypothetical protein